MYNMKPKSILNYTAISELLTENDNSIRKGKCPKKYKEQMQELENFIEYWKHKYIKQKK